MTIFEALALLKDTTLLYPRSEIGLRIVLG